jgi:putative transposase
MAMRKSRFTESRSRTHLGRRRPTPVTEVRRAMGVSEQTYYRWKKSYGGLGVHEIRRLKLLEEENRRLKAAGRGFLARQADAAGRAAKKL